MSDPHDLSAFLDLGWQRLSRGVADRKAAARHPVFATVSPDGMPEARTIVLRAADRETATLEVHTDGGSGKIRSLQAHPVAQLHVWDERVKLLIRATSSDWFTVLTCRLVDIELMQLGDPHRRAVFTRETDWSGQWLVP